MSIKKTNQQQSNPNSTFSQLAKARSGNGRSFLLLLNTPDHQAAVKKFLQDQFALDFKTNQTDINWFNTEEESLKIKTVREVINQTSYGSYSGEGSIYVILKADQSSIPAQNALLKIVEEPPHDSLMILTATQPKQLLPTIHSRCLVINLQTQHKESRVSEKAQQIAQQILDPSFSYAAAIDLAEQYKNRAEAQQLLTELINYLHQKLKTGAQNSRITKTLKILLECYQDLNQNLNTRLALEHSFFRLKMI
jgi:DNA polymerase III delta prime subunit